MMSLPDFLGIFRATDDKKRSWWNYRFRSGAKRQKMPKHLRPWQLRQWLGRDIETGKELWTPAASLETRQRRRQALRILCMKQITEKYSAEPRAARRRIARRLAVKAFGEMRESNGVLIRREEAA
jgi:hypothetical protein